MLGIAPSRAKGVTVRHENEAPAPRAYADRWSALAASTIFVLGSPRSGTSWLAKILDSHPEILYRHEPDELTSSYDGNEPLGQVRAWLQERGLRAAAKRPTFRKSWRPMPLEVLRIVLASALAMAQRTPLVSRIAQRAYLPDLIPSFRWRSVRAVIKLVNWDGTAIARTMPDTRCIFILRHPCGQVASMIAGLAARQFITTNNGAPIDVGKAAAFAAGHGVDAASFAALPDAAKYAWSWRAFNEPAVEALRSSPNARIVVYEDLCQQPELLSRDLFAFAGLNWHPNTTAFLDTSTHDSGGSGYYDVFRATGQIADRWRQILSQQDQEAVRSVIATSALARCWPDLASTAG